MLLQLNKTHRIVSNPCGGFDWQQADVDKETGLIRTHSKTGNEAWKFHQFHPTIDRLLESYVMECTPVVDTALTDAAMIALTIRAEYAEVKKLFEPLSKELDAVTKERDRLAKLAKPKKQADESDK